MLLTCEFGPALFIQRVEEERRSEAGTRRDGIRGGRWGRVERTGQEKKTGTEIGGEMEERPHVRYSPLSNQDEFLDRYVLSSSSWWEGDAEEDLRYKFELHEEIPWRSIFLGLFLLTMGCVFLMVSYFIFIEHMGGELSQAYRFLVLGILLVLPGYYATRIAYYSWRGYKGFKFSGIPAY